MYLLVQSSDHNLTYLSMDVKVINQVISQMQATNQAFLANLVKENRYFVEKQLGIEKLQLEQHF